MFGKFFAGELFVVIEHLWYYALNHRKSIPQGVATKLLFQALFRTTAHGLLLKDLLGMKKCRQKRPFGLCWRQNDAIWFLRFMVIITDQAQFWARYDFHTPLVLIKIFFLVDVFAVYSRSFLFFHIFWTFDHWFKCVQVAHIIFLSSKDRKPRNTSAKTIFEAATTGKIFLSS